CTSSSLDTSATMPTPPISRATPSTCSRERAETATRIPAAASSRAMFAPIPRPPPVTSATWPSSSDDGTGDLVEDIWVLQRRKIAGILAEHARTDGAAHDLRAPRLRQCRHEQDAVRLERLAELV